MNFVYTDRILELIPGKFARGIKNVTRTDPLLYSVGDGTHALSPAAVTESLAQLTSWSEIVASDFTKRPVLLTDEKTEFLLPIRCGDQIELEVEVMSRNDEVVTTKSTARIRGETAQIAECGRGYLMDLKLFENPEDVRSRYTNLFNREKPFIAHLSSPSVSVFPPAHLQDPYGHIDMVLGIDKKISVQTAKLFTATEGFFASHFPRKPIVPGVLLMSFVGESCRYLHAESFEQSMFIPRFMRNLRCRKFVEPGDCCKADIKLTQTNKHELLDEFIFAATVTANGQRVLTAELGFLSPRAGVSLTDLQAEYAKIATL